MTCEQRALWHPTSPSPEPMPRFMPSSFQIRAIRARRMAIAAVALLAVSVVVVGSASRAAARSYRCQANPANSRAPLATVVDFNSGTAFPVIQWLPEVMGADDAALQASCELAAALLQQSVGEPYIRTGTVDDENVLCVASDRRDVCGPNTVIAALRPGVDRHQALIALLGLRQLTDGSGLFFTDDLVTYVDREAVVSLGAMFDIADDSASSFDSDAPDSEETGEPSESSGDDAGTAPNPKKPR